MTPKKIYLSKEELQDITTCERMVSIDEPFDVMTEEYVNLKQVWHDWREEPQGTYIVLCDGLDNTQWVTSYDYIDFAYVSWKDYTELIDVVRWAYISDLLPKGGAK